MIVGLGSGNNTAVASAAAEISGKFEICAKGVVAANSFREIEGCIRMVSPVLGFRWHAAVADVLQLCAGVADLLRQCARDGL
jgi:hypothetical protein